MLLQRVTKKSQVCKFVTCINYLSFFTQVVGNIPECAEKQLMPTHSPLELVNWDYLCKEDQKMFNKRQNNEKRNKNPKANNEKV